eukprot:773148-Amphidinium_carterae.2
MPQQTHQKEGVVQLRLARARECEIVRHACVTTIIEAEDLLSAAPQTISIFQCTGTPVEHRKCQTSHVDSSAVNLHMAHVSHCSGELLLCSASLQKTHIQPCTFKNCQKLHRAHEIPSMTISSWKDSRMPLVNARRK